MSSDLDSLIGYLQDTAAFKNYALATCTIFFYDYVLTLSDEVKYAWSGKKSWTFWIFIANRYFPMTYYFWLLAFSYSPHPSVSACDKIAFYPIFAYVFCNTIAQVVLTLRIYAITGKSVRITTGFTVIFVAQVGLGICLVTVPALNKSQRVPPMPLDPSRLCVPIRHRPIEVAYTSVALLYDSLMFLLIVYLVKKSKATGFTGILLKTIMEDATLYFLIIFSSHLVFEFTLLFGREMIQIVPASGTIAYLPVMISRLMLSLKKAADLRQGGWWSTEEPVNGNNSQSIRFYRSRQGMNGRGGDITLDTYTVS